MSTNGGINDDAPDGRPRRLSGMTEEQLERAAERWQAREAQTLHLKRWVGLILILVVVGLVIWNLPEIMNWFSRR
jgi:hypothetical protein